jgi:hypothetical protein
MSATTEGLRFGSERAASSRSVAIDEAVTNESSASAVSWTAVLAGAVVAASISLLLVVLGSGLGFASASPWSHEGASATTLSVMTLAWLIIVQWVASGLGGYITGRLRTKWVGVHTHEVFFRDTAHGFVTWAVATVIVAVVVASAATTAVSGVTRAASSVASGVTTIGANAAASGAASGNGYEIDSLFRSTNANPVNDQSRSEALRILARGITQGEVPAADRDYLVELVAARAGIPKEEAQQRVDSAITQLKAAEVKAREAADAARKAAASVSIFTALSMLIGAFIACVAAAIGGGQRDEHA